MKILETKPGIVHRCKSCGSSYEIEDGDLGLKIGGDYDLYYADFRPDTFYYTWKCPVCEIEVVSNTGRNSQFPKGWMDKPLKENGWSYEWLNEHNKAKEASYEVERLKLEASKITFSTPRNRKRGFWSRLFSRSQ